ncbi:STM4011 family radical SAM protein [Tissierellaceae bacterium HCP3S3_D8]
MEGIKAITYRGSLKSCNYRCSYCPFSKYQQTLEEIQNDKRNLERFCNQLKNIRFKEPIRILFTPYGEALIHSYYQQSIIDLSKQNFVKRIGCQTNLSIQVEDFIMNLIKQNAVLEKIVLWTTFHPDMTTVDEFSEKIWKLSSNISLSVGVVGNPISMEQIQKLRDKLPPNIYMWINQMDGLKRRYTEEEKNLFNKIDPLFNWELKRHIGSICESGKNHLFIDAKGDQYPCNRALQKLGNLYKEQERHSPLKCSGKRCDCYLAYSHTNGFKDISFLGEESLLRVPKRLRAKAIFLDIDGTILDKYGKIPKETKTSLEYIAQKIPIYLATELPYTIALKKCRQITGLLSGGCFSGGAHCIDWGTNYEIYTYLPSITNRIKDKDIKSYTHEDKIYRMILPKKLFQRYEELFSCKDIKQIPQGMGRVSLVKKGVSKANGVYQLSQKLGIYEEEIICVGNDIQDIEMLKRAGYGIAVPRSMDSVKEVADYVLEVWQLAYIL